MNYASVCDGIGAAHVAWQPLGWECRWTSEIEPFPCAVVDHHWGFPNLGDMTKITKEDARKHGPIDLLVGGTPCQSFSVAGLRKGLADPRGNLALVYLALADLLRPTWLVWENVPGVLSSNRGRDFGSFLGAMGQLGYGFAYRVLDARFFGVPQRRERLFVVGCVDGWAGAAAVLFEPEGDRGDCPEGQSYPCMGANDDRKWGSNQWVKSGHMVIDRVGARRITPEEGEALMGFPVGYTDIRPPTPDGPRMRSLGNSMAVNVMSWLGKRLEAAA